MKKPLNANGGWSPATTTPEFEAKHPAAEVERWRKLHARTVDAANANGWSKSEVGRRSGIAETTFSQWSNGNYLGLLSNVNDTVANWLDALEESAGVAAALPVSPRFQKTPTGVDITETLLFAQISAGLVMITLPSGAGKTTAAKHFCATRPHAYLVTASPHTKTVHGTLVDIALELDVVEHNPARLVRSIGRKLGRIGEGSLLIVDEAQNLVPDAVNQLRHFVDIHKCGVALLGNEDTAVSFVKERGSVMSRAQVASRFDRRLKREREPGRAATMLIAAWGIEDEKCVKFLLGIASKPGALRNIDRTIKAALIASHFAGNDLQLEHLIQAWKNRDLGEAA